MLRVGVIGMGFMGRMHFKNWNCLDDAKVIAVCDEREIDPAGVSGNLDTGEPLNLEGVAIYRDVSGLLQNEQLDAVSVTLPTFLHKDISVQCLLAGVHVLCEKPMALNIDDCDAMIRASGESGKQLMVAHCIRFWPEYAYIKNISVSGEFGKIVAADLGRLSTPPGWGSGGWFTDASKSGGIALDLHIHDLDFLQYLLGMPKRLHSVAAEIKAGIPGHLMTQMQYPDGSVAAVTASWMMPGSFGFRMSYRILFDKAQAIFDGSELTVFPQEGEPFQPELPPEDGYFAEIRYFADLIAGRVRQPVITPQQARESVRLALEAAAV